MKAEPTKIKLTERAVARLKPPTGRVFVDVWDATLPAFGIQLRSTGRRAWIIAVRRPGKSTTSRIKIGDPATMSLAEARARAQELMRDPSALELEESEPDALDPDSLTADSPIDAVIAGFILRDQKPRNRSWKCSEQILRHDLKSWYDRPLGSILRADVIQLLDRVLDRGKPRAANLLLAHVKRMFNWTIERGLLETSPAALVKPPSPRSERDRVLTDPELYEAWHGCDRLGWPFGPLVQLLILTAQREGEVAAMRWSDLDLETGIWTLASAQTKAKRAHLIPLSAATALILRTLPRFDGCDFVFPAHRTGNARPVSGFSTVKARLDKICGVQDWVLHDLRRTTATKMAELKVPPHVTEKILNHSASKTVGPMGKIYQRYDYLEERRDALEQWAAALTRIVIRDKVVRLRVS
jgi:integrase